MPCTPTWGVAPSGSPKPNRTSDTHRHVTWPCLMVAPVVIAMIALAIAAAA
ncbi:hypothetical protein [Mycobacterium sp. 050134]|uniref:hypothetical protein n=1 Tax=Mycobacterium sp. 050134 TaxID=3096111 RepID=UPI002EDA5B5D